MAGVPSFGMECDVVKRLVCASIQQSRRGAWDGGDILSCTRAEAFHTLAICL